MSLANLFTMLDAADAKPNVVALADNTAKALRMPFVLDRKQIGAANIAYLIAASTDLAQQLIPGDMDEFYRIINLAQSRYNDALSPTRVGAHLKAYIIGL